MNRLVPGIILGLLLGAGGAWLFLKPKIGPAEHEEAEAHKEKEKEHGEKDEHEEKEARPVTIARTAEGAVQITVDPSTQKRIGLQTAPVLATNLGQEYRASGRVLDPAPLHQQLLDVRTALAGLDASRREHERLKSLFAQNQNASARALETAAVAAQRDQALAEAARVRLLTTWGPGLAERTDLDQVITNLIRRSTLLLRLDLPIGDTPGGDVTSAAVTALGNDAPRWPAELIGSVPSADPFAQGAGYLALLHTNVFAPGAVVYGWLSAGTNQQAGVVVPRTAVVRHEGETFVYAEAGTNIFERHEVILNRPLPEGFFVSEGLEAQRRVVTIGAQLLLSEELRGKGGEE